MTSHYLKQCWLLVTWTFSNKLLWNFNPNWYTFKKMPLKISSTKWWRHYRPQYVKKINVDGEPLGRSTINMQWIAMTRWQDVGGHLCKGMSCIMRYYGHDDMKPCCQRSYLRGHHTSLLWTSLQWRHNECDGVSNHRCLDCLLNQLVRRWSKKTSKHHVTGLCEWNPPVTGGFPSQRASNSQNVSIWWCHHVFKII